MTKTTWTYEKFERHIDRLIKWLRTFEQCEDDFDKSMAEHEGKLPLIRAVLFNAFHSALALASVRFAICDPYRSLSAIHLMWRAKSLSLAAYLEFMDREFERKGRPRIRRLGSTDVNDLLVLIATAIVFGEDDAAIYFYSKIDPAS